MITMFTNTPATDPINVAWMIERTARSIYDCVPLATIAKLEGYTEETLTRQLQRSGMEVANDSDGYPLLVHSATGTPVAFPEIHRENGGF